MSGTHAPGGPLHGRNSALTRRGFCAAALAAGAGAWAAGGCRQRLNTSAVAKASPGEGRDLVVYCSADAVYAAPIFDAFTRASGVKVLAVYDTEATKTTGLVNRLLEEKAAPRADVWWSSEPFGTIRLAREGVLQPTRCPAAEAAMGPAGWPAHLKDANSGDRGPRWYGFGSRARVYVFNAKHVRPEDAPASPAALLRPELKGRIAMARPQFGTTRGHMGLLAAAFGEAALERWLSSMKAHGVRLLDGNAAVVRAVATGEAWAGMTDSDDVFAGQREGWPVDWRHERVECGAPAGAPGWAPGADVAGCGTLLLPNTVSRVRREPAAVGAEALMEYLLSPACQRLLAATDSRNLPVDQALAAELGAGTGGAGPAAWAPAPGNVVTMDLDRIADAIPAAMKACERALGG